MAKKEKDYVADAARLTADYYEDLIVTMTDDYGPKEPSPIEKGMFAYLLYKGHCSELAPWRFQQDQIEWKRKPEVARRAGVYVWHQTKVGKYKADFLIEVWEGGVRRSLVVECDGHDFHEKSKDQVRRDKERDRFMTQQGIRLMRFSGSEIWRDAEKCSDQIASFVFDLFHECWREAAGK